MVPLLSMLLQMPLSFLASFFALNVDRFPRSLDGGVEFGLPWVAGLICKFPDIYLLISYIHLTIKYSRCHRGVRGAFRHWRVLLRCSRRKRTSSQLVTSLIEANCLSFSAN